MIAAKWIPERSDLGGAREAWPHPSDPRRPSVGMLSPTCAPLHRRGVLLLWLAFLALPLGCARSLTETIPQPVPMNGRAIVQGSGSGWISVSFTGQITLEFGIGQKVILVDENPADVGRRFLSRVARYLSAGPRRGAWEGLHVVVPPDCRMAWLFEVREMLDTIASDAQLHVVVVRDQGTLITFVLRSADFLSGEDVIALLVWSPDPNEVGAIHCSTARDSDSFPLIMVEEPGFSTVRDSLVDENVAVFLDGVEAGARPCLAIDTRLPLSAALPMVEQMVQSDLGEFYLTLLTVLPCPALSGE